MVGGTQGLRAGRQEAHHAAPRPRVARIPDLGTPRSPRALRRTPDSALRETLPGRGPAADRPLLGWTHSPILFTSPGTSWIAMRSTSAPFLNKSNVRARDEAETTPERPSTSSPERRASELPWLR